MARNREKHSPYFNLKDAFREKHCPICYLARRSVTHYLDGLLYERVTDSGTIQSMRAAEGFCQNHFGQVVEFQDATSLSHLARYALEFLVQKWRQNPNEILRKSKQKAFCPACENWNETEKNYISLFLENLDDLSLMTDYKHSFGFCVPHFRMVYSKVESKEHRRSLLETQLSKMESLVKELAEFERKHSYEHHGESYGSEVDSRFRAVEVLKGRSDRLQEKRGRQ